MLKRLDIIVGKAECAKNNGGQQHQKHIHIAEFSHEQTRQQNAQDDYESAHGGNAFFLYAKRVGLLITLLLRDMFPPEEMDKPFAYEDADNERHHARYDSAEGDVLE